jgi:hypothetical protein
VSDRALLAILPLSEIGYARARASRTIRQRESLNPDEGSFATLTKRRLKRGVFRSIVALQTAINRFLAEHNRDPRPTGGPKAQQNHRRREERVPSVDSIH